MAQPQTGHRKSSLVLTARFPVVKWRSRSVAKSAYWGSVREWQKSRLVSLCASLRESSPSCVSSRVTLTRDFSQYPPNGELTRRQAPRAFDAQFLARQTKPQAKQNKYNVHLYITIFYHLPKISLFLKVLLWSNQASFVFFVFYNVWKLINTHTKFETVIPTGSPTFWAMFFSGGRPPLPKQEMAERKGGIGSRSSVTSSYPLN